MDRKSATEVHAETGSDRITYRPIIAIRYSGRIYAARAEATGKVDVVAGQTTCLGLSEEKAHLWLGDRGLRRSKIKALLRAAIRLEGPYANPNHPARIKHDT